MQKLTLSCVALGIAVIAVFAQSQQAPKPGAEQKKLEVFVGIWTVEGVMKAGPLGPGGKVTGTRSIQWMPGGFFLEHRFKGKSPAGEETGLEIQGYDAARKTYTSHVFSSSGNDCFRHMDQQRRHVDGREHRGSTQRPNRT